MWPQFGWTSTIATCVDALQLSSGTAGSMGLPQIRRGRCHVEDIKGGRKCRELGAGPWTSPGISATIYLNNLATYTQCASTPSRSYLKPYTFELKHCRAENAPMLLCVLLCGSPYNARQCIFLDPLTFVRVERSRSLNRLLRTVPRNARDLRDK